MKFPTPQRKPTLALLGAPVPLQEAGVDVTLNSLPEDNPSIQLQSPLSLPLAQHNAEEQAYLPD